MLNKGTYTAKMTDYGITTTQAGLPQLKCSFAITDGATVYNMAWYGSFKEGKARDITIKTMLSVMDLFAEPNEIENELAKIAEQGAASGLLNCEKDYSVVVEQEPDQTGKVRARIRWVNNPGGTASFERLAATDAKKLFSGMGLSGAVAQLKAENPGLTKKKTTSNLPF